LEDNARSKKARGEGRKRADGHDVNEKDASSGKYPIIIIKTAIFLIFWRPRRKNPGEKKAEKKHEETSCEVE
jgi:hypothetical protein